MSDDITYFWDQWAAEALFEMLTRDMEALGKALDRAEAERIKAFEQECEHRGLALDPDLEEPLSLPGWSRLDWSDEYGVDYRGSRQSRQDDSGEEARGVGE